MPCCKWIHINILKTCYKKDGCVTHCWEGGKQPRKFLLLRCFCSEPRAQDLRDAVLVKGLQSAIAVLGSGSLVHVAETLHGRDVALDALLWNVQLGYEGQVSTVIETEQHWAAVMTL